MVWLFRLLWVIAAAITSLFARDALNFGFIEVLMTMILTIGIVAIAIGWNARREL